MENLINKYNTWLDKINNKWENTDDLPLIHLPGIIPTCKVDSMGVPLLFVGYAITCLIVANMVCGIKMSALTDSLHPIEDVASYYFVKG